MPLISVIIPIYNVEKYLHQCIDSVIGQSFQDLEIILVNDGSPDNCLNICEEYKSIDNRIKVIHKENGGLSDARNAGLKIATGKYVTFLDSDDFWEGKDSLEKCVQIVEDQTDLDILFFDALRYYEEKNLKIFGDKLLDRKEINTKSKEDVLKYLVEITDVRVSACTKIINREFLIQNDLYFKKGIYSEDVEWFLRVLLYAKSYDYANIYMYIYRKNRMGSITNTIGIKNIIDILDTIESTIAELHKQDNTKDFYVNYMSYLAYHYTIVLGLYAGVNDTDKSKLFYSRIKSLSSLLQYDKYKNTKQIKWINKIVGTKITSLILGLYLRVR